jgi:hypothetical protein
MLVLPQALEILGPALVVMVRREERHGEGSVVGGTMVVQ